MIATLSFVTGLSLGMFAGPAVPVSAPATLPVLSSLLLQDAPETLKVDTTHSSLVFRIVHGGVADFYGSFGRMEGTVVWDHTNVANSSIRITVPIESVNTNNTGRDSHLKNPDFFDVENHPAASFESTSISAGADASSFQVEGNLTMVGKTVPVSFPVQITGAKKDETGKTQVVGARAQFTIKRSDWGINYGLPASLSDEVTLMISIQAGIPRQR